MTLVATQVKRRRGTNDENDAFAGAEGEITVDLTNKELRVHTGGGKLGGFRIGRHTDRTNCVIEEPNNINLEINNGQLVLKSGSKVYVPNGVGNFNEITIQNDINIPAIANRTTMIFYRDGSFQRMDIMDCFSGTSAPTLSRANAVWYDTANNIVKVTNNTGATWSSNNVSLPVAVATETTSGFAGIKQIFDSTGFIGKTLFAIMGTCGLIPDGRNQDGSLKNIECRLPWVTTRTLTYDLNANCMFGITEGGGIVHIRENFYMESKFLPDFKEYGRLLVTSENKMYYGTIGGNSWSPATEKFFVCGTFRSDANGRIIDFSPNSAFSALDCNKTDFIARQSMPSTKYVDLTLGTSGTVYTAPADGYVAIRQYFASAQDVNFVGIYHYDASIDIMQSRPAQSDVATFMPIKKGQRFRVYYNNITSNVASYFRFVFAEGVLS